MVHKLDINDWTLFLLYIWAESYLLFLKVVSFVICILGIAWTSCGFVFDVCVSINYVTKKTNLNLVIKHETCSAFLVIAQISHLYLLVEGKPGNTGPSCSKAD